MDPFVAEIRIVPFNFAPKGWALCNGQILPISQNTALFSLLGTMYGGDGKSTFGLPNFQGSAPMQWGQGPGLSYRDIGEVGVEATVTLLTSEIPAHAHTVQGTSASGGLTSPAGNSWGSAARGRPGAYAPSQGANNLQMSPLGLSPSGGSQPHNNMQPYLVLNFIIALQGVYPPRS